MKDGLKNQRLFVAVPVSPEVKEALARALSPLVSLLPDGVANWTAADHLHLTLRFLGNVEATKLAGLSEHLRRATSGFGALELGCSGLGCFPYERLPRVLWAGVFSTGERLAALAQVVEAATASFVSQPAESKFAGHIALARFKRISRQHAETVGQFIRQAGAREIARWQGDRVELIRSELASQGSRYTTLAALSLV